MNRILVAIDDSPPALAAADTAIQLARSLTAAVHFVAITEPDHQTTTVLHYVVAQAENAGLSPMSTATDGGQPFEALLRIAHEWEADLIVMGRSDTRRPGLPYVGNQTEHVLEFTHIPVLVVPQPDNDGSSRTSTQGQQP